MTIKYCDHGVYANSATFTAAVGSNSDTLTVSGCTGVISRGASVLGLDPVKFPYPVQISAFQSGTGGNGTYTLTYSSLGSAISGASASSVMGQPALVPTWGVCQDGDGSAKTAATPATASIVFTGVPSSGSIYVLGVPVTATWATNADTCANNLAAAINALTTTAVGPASFTTKSQVNNHLYARGPASGAPAGTCQVMTRQGSASHAGLICFTHTLNNVSSAATVNFSGGSGGALGWLFNAAPIWVGNVASLTYGLFTTITGYTAGLSAGDRIKVRAGKTLYFYTINWGGQTTWALPNIGTKQSPVVFEIDDSTEWADGAQPVLEICYSAYPGSQWNQFFYAQSGYFAVLAKRYSDTRYGLKFSTIGNRNNGEHTMSLPVSSKCYLEGVAFECYAGGGTVTLYRGIDSYQMDGLVVSRSLFKLYNGLATGLCFVDTGGISNKQYFKLMDCIVDAGAPSGITNPVLRTNADPYQVYRSVFDNVRFVNFVTGSVLHAPLSGNINTSVSTSFRNCDFGGITSLGPTMGNTQNVSPKDHRTLEYALVASTQKPAADFFVDTPQGWCAWISTRSFPTLNARLQDGVTPWSVQIIPTQQAPNLNRMNPFEAPRFVTINTLASGSRTLVFNFGVEQSLAFTRADVSVLVEYLGTDGFMHTVDSFDIGASALATNSEAWTNPVGGQFKFANTGDVYFNKFQISLTTPTAIKGVDFEGDLGSEIGWIFRVHTSVSDTTKMLFVCPEALMT